MREDEEASVSHALYAANWSIPMGPGTTGQVQVCLPSPLLIYSARGGMKLMTTLEQEVMDVKTRLEHLEAVIRRLTGDTHQAGTPVPTMPLDQTELLAWLKAH